SPIAQRIRSLVEAGVTERAECCVVKLLGAREVVDPDGDVIEHRDLLDPIRCHDLRRHLNSARNRHVVPPSVENSPSQWNESGVISLKLQRVSLPSSDFPSWTISVPCARPICRP